MTNEKTVNTSNVSAMIDSSDNKPVKKDVGFQSLLKKMEGEIQKALPKVMTPERFIRVAMTAYRQNPKLQQCDGTSIIAALMESAQLGLEVNTPLGHAYIIPYGKQAQYQIGYQGILELCYRTGEYKQIAAYEVYEQDEFDYELGLNQKLYHKPHKSPAGEPTFYYAIYKRKDGGEGFFVMSREQVLAHKTKYSKTDYGWKLDFNAMAKKTVIKKALKTAQKSIEISKAMAFDETVKNEISPNMMDVASSIDLVEGE